MKHAIKTMLSVLAVLGILLTGAGCDYVLNERTFFKTMTNMLAFPSSYMGSNIELDCFVYELTDVESGEEYTLGVRKCSSGVGCTCGNDTVIGFILDYDGEIPAAKNQSADNGDKTWIHIAGSLESAEKVYVSVYAYRDGQQTENIEQIYFYRFRVDTLQEIDGTGLQYYVTK